MRAERKSVLLLIRGTFSGGQKDSDSLQEGGIYVDEVKTVYSCCNVCVFIQCIYEDNNYLSNRPLW